MGLGYSGGSNVITKVLVRERRGSESGRTCSVIADFEDGRGGHKPSTAGGLAMLGKARRQMVPWKLQEERRTSHLSLWKDAQSVVICYSHERPVQAPTLGVQENTQDGGPPPTMSD